MFTLEVPNVQDRTAPESDENDGTHKLSENRGGNASESRARRRRLAKLIYDAFAMHPPPSSLGQTEEGDGRTF